MTLDQLRSLLAVARHLSFREAAKDLHLTQPAISKQLSILQRELGTRFYKRSGKGVELTEAGRLAFSKLAPIAKQLDDFEALFRTKNSTAPKRPTLSVAATFGLATRVMTSLVARFEREHPDTEIRWDTGSSGRVQRLVHEGQIAVALSGYRPLFNDLVVEPFRVEQLVFFVKPHHPLARRRHVTLREVLAHPLVIRNVNIEPTATHDILEELSQKGFSYKVALWCSEPLLIREAVAKNVGVGISYLENLRSDVSRGRFVVLKGADFHFTTLSYIVYSKKHELSPLAKKFLELLRQARKISGADRLKEFAEELNSPVMTRVKKSSKAE